MANAIIWNRAEAARKATYIRYIVDSNGLSYSKWLARELGERGIDVSKTELSDFLSMRLKTKKAWLTLVEAEKICKRYERSFKSRRQSGN